MSVWRLALVLCVVCTINAAVTRSAPRVAPVCLNGAPDGAGKCVCNFGFSDFQGNCFLTADTRSRNTCPLGSTMRDGYCHFLPLPPTRDVLPAQEKTIVVPPLRITIPLPELLEPESENGEVYEPNGDGDDEQPVRDVKLGFERFVNNQNVITNETSVHTVNENNVVIHLVRKLPSGAFRTEIVRNNVTTVYDEEVTQDAEDTTSSDELPTTEMVPEKPRCCKIVSPRVCQKQADEWVCFHRKQYVCSKVCTADEMYLRPRRITYRKPWLIMPPGTNRTMEPCFLGRCPKPDCSGCLRGKRGCHAMCYTYDCAVDNACHFLDWDMICRDDLTQVCTLLEEKIIRNPKPA